MATTPFATFDQAVAWQAGAELLAKYDEASGLDLMISATEEIEDRCDRRLAPFTVTESHRATGVDQDILGSADMPLDITGALGYSQALAFASVNMVRDVMLEEYAPRRQDLWSYTVTQIELLRAYGDTQIVPATEIEGPEPDTGHFRFHLGVFCPVGTFIRVTYQGGYTAGIPTALNKACIYQAFKLAIVGAEPEARKELSLAELDAMILGQIAPYIR
jgi:hypothetical protein